MELKGGGKDYSDILSVFLSVKNDVVLINFIILYTCMLPQENFLMCSTLETVSGGF